MYCSRGGQLVRIAYECFGMWKRGVFRKDKFHSHLCNRDSLFLQFYLPSRAGWKIVMRGIRGRYTLLVIILFSNWKRLRDQSRFWIENTRGYSLFHVRAKTTNVHFMDKLQSPEGKIIWGGGGVLHKFTFSRHPLYGYFKISFCFAIYRTCIFPSPQ